jgi:hypothetical protein
MSDGTAQSADFLIAVGVSFCEALLDQPGYSEGSPHDYQEILARVLGTSFDSHDLQAALAGDGPSHIATACAHYFETSPPPTAVISNALLHCLYRRPATARFVQGARQGAHQSASPARHLARTRLCGL